MSMKTNYVIPAVEVMVLQTESLMEGVSTHTSETSQIGDTSAKEGFVFGEYDDEADETSENNFWE